jgi:cytochrome c5
MRNIISALLAVVILLSCVRVAGHAQGPAANQKAATVAPTSTAASRKEGELRFRANCGRCHNPPETLSPREVKAVMQHMRVRAMLSAEDEQLILKYLAP